MCSYANSSYYDLRYVILLLAPMLKSGYTPPTDEPSVYSNILLVLISVLSMAVFMLTSIRIQICCCAARGYYRRLQLRIGRAALSVPVALSLAVVLLLPPFAFWTAYFFVFLIGFWSDFIHDFFFGFSYDYPVHIWSPGARRHPLLPM